VLFVLLRVVTSFSVLVLGGLLGTLYMASGRNGETHNEDHYEFDEETKTYRRPRG
jgi:hypothetical protein